MKVNVNYLQRDPKTGILRYRRPFPERLRRFVRDDGKPMSELKVTLRVRSITDPGAQERYWAQAKRYAVMVERAEKVAADRFDELDTATIADLVEWYRQEELAHDNERRFDPEAKARGLQVTTGAEQAGWDLPPHRQSARWSQGLKIVIDTVLEAYRGFAADGDLEGMIEAWSGQAQLLASSGGLHVDQSSAGFHQLCVQLNEAAVGVHQDMLGRLDGQVVPTPSKPMPPPRATMRRATSRTVEAIFLELIDKPRAPYKEPTKESVRGGLRFLREAVGNPTPAELTRAMVTTYLDLLAQKPAKVAKGEGSLKLKALVARYADRPQVKRLTDKTLEKYNNALNARWKEAQVAGSISETLASPFANRKFGKARKGRRTAEGFTDQELTAFFSLPVYTNNARPVRGKGETVYWLPLLALFTGARPEEIAQLLVTDIYQDEQDGRWVMQITEEGLHPAKGQRSLKTESGESGRRTFPVHKGLQDLGLLDYRTYLVESGELALFPLLRRKGKRSGIYASFGEWMCDYIYDHGIIRRGEGRQPIREFRHTWTTAARASGIYREAMEYIQGHQAPGGGSTNEDYGKRQVLGDQIDRLNFNVEVVRIVPRWQPPARG